MVSGGGGEAPIFRAGFCCGKTDHGFVGDGNDLVVESAMKRTLR